MDPTELTPFSLDAIRSAVNPQVTLQPVDHDPFAENQGDMPMSPYIARPAGEVAKAVGQGMVDWAKTPGAQMQPNPYPAGSEEWQDYENQKTAQANQWGPQTALMMVGGGGPGAEVEGAVAGGGLRRDPRLWHGISQVKLPKPINEMQATIERAPIAEKLITPADLQGGQLLPAIGDRSAASGTLQGFNGYQFESPVELQGGHGYMPANTDRGVVWASNKGVISGLENKASALAESGQPVYFPYTAMGERSVDFSHHVSDALAEALPNASISSANKGLFNQVMLRDHPDFGPVPDWPGVGSSGLREYLQNASGNVRNKFAKTMDSTQFQKVGFPSVAEARFAVTDPRLLDVKTGDAGLSISQLNPGAPRAPSQHLTYEESLPGNYVGGLGTSVPKEVMYPDLIKAYNERGYEPLRHDYLMQRGLKSAPIAQQADQQWVDSVSNYLRSKGVLGSGAADETGSARTAAAFQQLEDVRHQTEQQGIIDSLPPPKTWQQKLQEETQGRSPAEILNADRVWATARQLQADQQVPFTKAFATVAEPILGRKMTPEEITKVMTGAARHGIGR